MYRLWSCIFVFLFVAQSSAQDGSGAGAYKSSYSRVSEALEKCPTASQQGGDVKSSVESPDLKWSIQNELAFTNGDWNSSSASDFLHIVPHAATEGPAFVPVRLASFWTTDVDDRSSKAPVKVSGILEVAVSAYRGISYFTAAEASSAVPGFSSMTALMEGVYFESSHERGVCMVGCTRLEEKRSCDLFLDLHFPKSLSLRSRVVHGSLSVGGFSIAISSQLGAFSKYEFVEGDLVASTCKSQKRRSLPPPETSLYRSNRFCATFMEIVSGNPIDLFVSSKSSSPFNLQVNASLQFHILDIRCVDIGKGKGANVSAIFRAVPPTVNPGISTERTGFGDGLAFAAEGVFDPSTGELCMVGCINEQICNTKISIFIPLTFSMTQRSSLVGSIDSVPFGLMSSLRTLPRKLGIEYRYSRLDAARRKAEKDSVSGSAIGDKIRLSMLSFPSLKVGGDVLQLGQDLSVANGLFPSSSNPALGDYLSLDVISIEDTVISAEVASPGASPSSSKPILRVAVVMTVTGSMNIPSLSAEGVYFSKSGKLYMVGCWPQHKQSSSSVATRSSSGEDLDCQVEIVVQYPPENAKWLVTPTVLVELSSTRARNDSLFFEKMRVETLPLLYRDQLSELASRKRLESALSVMTLSLMVLCIALQLIYVKSFKAAESVPFVSLLMLGVQAFGYSIPLITGVEALFSRLTSSSPTVAADSEASIHGGELSVVLLYLVKLLSLGAFLLMLRLSQKVVKSRIRLSTKFPLEPRKVPSEKKAAKIFLLVHAIGFAVVLAFHYILISGDDDYRIPASEGRIKQPRASTWNVCSQELKEYVGLIQDLFLLPQVIAFATWEKPIRGKPLRRSYYLGITVLRLLPHAYHAVSRPWFNPYYAADYSVFANPKVDFYNRIGDLVIPLVALGMAAAVYAQQRWNGLSWGKVARTGSSKLLRYGSKLYERIPSVGPERLGSSEAELMPSSEQA